MESTGQERRARHLERRRQAILEAAARVFARKGFDKATTREIAQEAEISEGTIYNYFASKQKLLEALVGVVQGEFTAIVSALPLSIDPRENLMLAMERVLGVIAQHATMIRGLVAALWDQSRGLECYLIPGAQDLILVVEQYLQAGISAGRLRPCDIHAVARMLMGMVVFIALPHLRGLEPAPSATERRRQAELLTTVFLYGLRV